MKILITPRSYAKHSEDSYKILEQNNIQYCKPDLGRILTEYEMMEYIADMDGIIVGVDPLNEKVLKHATNLKVISKYGVGTDNIDLDYCKKNDIKVTVTKNANTNAVADYAFTLMMAVARRVVEIDRLCHKNDWSKIVSNDIYGKTLGLIGMGNIGKGVAKRAAGFDMKIMAYDFVNDETFAEQYKIQYTNLDILLKSCDFISIHLPLTDKTSNIINSNSFKMMKQNAIIINTARGGLINENDLYYALVNQEIYGAGIDVFEEEPPKDSRLMKLKNLVMGSHTAASTFDAVNKMSILATENIVENL